MSLWSFSKPTLNRKGKGNGNTMSTLIKYKLTTQALTTHRGFQWEIGKKYTTSGEGRLCGPGWLHYYHDPLLAVVFNPIHARIVNPRLFEVEAGGKHLDDLGRKGGCTEMRLVKELELPKISPVQLQAFAVLCAKAVYSDNGGVWDSWAEKWLSGEDRTRESAARAVADAVADAVAYTGAVAVAYTGAVAVAAADAVAVAVAKVTYGKPLNLISLVNLAITYN